MFKNMSRFMVNNESEYTEMLRVIFNCACESFSFRKSTCLEDDREIIRIATTFVSNFRFEYVDEMSYFFEITPELLEICQFSAIAHYLCNTNRLERISRRDFIFRFGVGGYADRFISREKMQNEDKITNDVFLDESRHLNVHYRGIKARRRDEKYVDSLTEDHRKSGSASQVLP